jgi:hypothetical protein
MSRNAWSVAFALTLLAAAPADAGIIKGVLGIKGAEMS